MKKSIAMLLAVLMIVTMIPAVTFADGATDKAKMELVYMQYNDGVTENGSELNGANASGVNCKVVPIPDYENINVNDTFLVGIRMKDLNKIAPVRNGHGLYSTTIVLNYDTTFLKAEPTSRLRSLSPLRVGKSNGIFGEVDNAAGDDFVRYQLEGDTTTVTAADGIMKISINFNSGSENPTYPNADKYSDEQYIGIAKFTVVSKPAQETGAKILSFDYETKNGSSISFGTSGVAGGMYNSGVAGDLMKDIFDFDESGVALFPQGKTTMPGTVTLSAAKYGDTISPTYESLPSDGTNTYQWKRDDVNISGATSSTYKVTAADVGHTITVEVRNDNYSGSAKPATGIVPTAITLTLPAASAIPKAPPVAQNTPNARYSNQKMTITDTALGVISGESVELTYDIAYTDTSNVGTTTNVTATFRSTNNAGYVLPTDKVRTGVSGEITARALTGSVNVAGTPTYGETLTATLRDLSAGATAKYQWQMSEDGTNWTNISGATSSTLALDNADYIEKNIRVQVTADGFTGDPINSNATNKIAKKTLTVAGPYNVGAHKAGTTPSGEITIDDVTVKYVAKSVVPDGDEFELDADLSLEAPASNTYDLSDNTAKIKGTVTTKTVTGIAVKDGTPDTTTFDYGKPIDLAGLVITVTYDEGDPEDIPYADFESRGVTVTGMPTGTANVGSHTLTITYTESTTLNITVVKSDVDLTWTSGDAAHTQWVSSITGVTAPGVTVKVKDGDFVVTEGTPVVEIEITTGGTPAEGECTCEGGAENHDGTNSDCTYIPAVEGTPEWKSFEEAKAIDGALVIGNTYKIRAYYNAAETNANTNPVTSDKAIPGTLKIKQQTSGGHGGGSGMLTVRFDAGVNGKITKGSSTVKVAKNEKLKSSDIPTVTANEGYRFLGWTLDGSKTVDPTDAAVTSSVTYRALYNTGATHGVYMRGDSDGNFYPERNITRAEAAALIARLNANYSEGTKYSSSLTDVAAEEWYASAVNFCASSGLITGYDDGTFLPNNQITRQEFCAIVARYLNLSNSGEANFSDVNEDIWGAGYISQLAGKDIINGYEDGTFAPNAPIKRCEVVKILNGVFDRTPDASTVNEHIADYTVRIPDITSAHWAYYEILEAAIEHDHADFHKAN